MDIGKQSPLETRPQTVLKQCQGLGRPVRRYDNLMPGIVQVIECVEEALVGLLLAAHELNVIQQEHLYATVPLAERLGGPVSDGRDEVIGELLRSYVPYGQSPRGCGMADGVKQVSLTQPHAGIYEERIVALPGGIGYRSSGAIGQLVRRPNHEGIERVLGIKGGHGLCRRFHGRIIFARSRSARFKFQSLAGQSHRSILRFMPLPDSEDHVQRPLGHLLHRFLDGIVHTPFQPGHGKRGWRFHNELILVVGNSVGILQPCFKSRPG